MLRPLSSCLGCCSNSTTSIHSFYPPLIPLSSICVLDNVALQGPLSCDQADIDLARNLTYNPDPALDPANFTKLLNQVGVWTPKKKTMDYSPWFSA